MFPRLVLRSHYQVAEPKYLWAILSSTSPLQSSYPEVTAKRFKDALHTLGYSINLPAAKYAIDLAQAVGIINDGGSWTDKGLLVHLTRDFLSEGGTSLDWLALSDSQKIVTLTLFLECDGAALIYLTSHLATRNQVDGSSNSLATDMVTSVYREYLKLTVHSTERVTLRREIERLDRGYGGNTGAHKLLLHLQTLYRLGLAERKNSSRSFTSAADTRALDSFVRQIPNIGTLEKVIGQRTLVEMSVSILFGAHPQNADDALERKVTSVMMKVYAEVRHAGINLCPISSLIACTQIRLFATGILLSHDEVLRILSVEQKRFPRGIRFHVNRLGAPAFVAIDASSYNPSQ